MGEPEKGKIIIHVTDVHKCYGSNHVLRGINLTVETGSIYALLGPSGCGKTSLMNCIVGRSVSDSGIINLDFSQHRDIGFMPQDISLHQYLSIEDTIKFYGYLYEMSDCEIRRRVKFLKEMLELPSLDKQITELSGGQQRRVSLAIALLHDPKIIILDEPTVGLDPLLSKSIWDRLVIMAENGKTIILSTHYIEEARQAHTIGLMRNGRMLTQDTPSNLLKKYNTNYLEDAFLDLCQLDDGSQNSNVSNFSSGNKSKVTFRSSTKFSNTRIKAQIWKNFCMIKRNVWMTLFILLLPLVLNFCVKQAIGHEPVYLPLGVINQEMRDSLNNCPRSYTNSCILGNPDVRASCILINNLRNRTYQVKEVEEVDKSTRGTVWNRSYGVLMFPENFTEALGSRIWQGINIPNVSLENSFANAYLDSSDFILHWQMSSDISKAVMETARTSFETCSVNINLRTLEPILKVEKPIYGDSSWDFFVFFLYGFNILNIFFVPMIFSCALLFDEKENGVIERILCTGATMWEMMCSHTIVQTFMMLAQAIEVMIISYSVFNEPLEGSPFLIFIILFITGLTGICLGTSIALVTDHLINSINFGVGFNFLISFSTGLLWPLEGAHWALRSILSCTPMAGTILASREISIKGYGVKQWSVMRGLLLTIGWLIVSILSILLIIVKRQKAWNTQK